MRVSGQNYNTSIRPDNTISGPVSRTGESEGVESFENSAPEDRVELSSEARAIQRARDVALSAPDIREERVDAARRALENGTLVLNGAQLADKIIQQASQG